MQILDIPIDQNQMETTSHGSFSFPLAVYRSVLSQNVLGFINWHWHDELQFCYVDAGAVTFYINGGQHLLTAGDGIFVSGGYLHMARPAGGPDSAYLCLDINPRLLSSFPGSVFETDYVAPYLKDPGMADLPLRACIPWQRDLLSHIPQIYRLCEAGAFGYELRVLSQISAMWLALLEHRDSAPGGRTGQRLQSNTAVQTILTYIHQHYQERLTIDHIAKTVLFSPSECCRLFKKITGETIFSYLQSYRLARSTELLGRTGLSVSQIAYETGFCSTSYYIEVFRRKFQITPRQYRKSLTDLS